MKTIKDFNEHMTAGYNDATQLEFPKRNHRREGQMKAAIKAIENTRPTCFKDVQEFCQALAVLEAAERMDKKKALELHGRPFHKKDLQAWMQVKRLLESLPDKPDEKKP